MEDDKKINYFGETSFRNQKQRFGIMKNDRRKHMYIIGKTGMGKSTLLENMAMQDIQNGEGLAFIDPHGTTAYKLLDFVPEHRINDVIYFDPGDLDFPIGLNIMENVDSTRRHFVASGLMSVFKKIFGPDVWSARMEYILGNTVLALLEYPGSTLLSVNSMLSVKTFRKKVVDNITDPVVKAFWTQEFAKYTEKFAAEATPAIQNKVGQFTSNPLIRNILGQAKSAFDFRKAMDEKKILIMNLAKGRVGEENMRLIGAMVVTKLYLAAMSRVDTPDERKLVDFFLYVDEFQNFATESFANILAEARKYRLDLILANQYLAQLDETVRDAVIGNVGTLLAFRVGSDDAEIIEKDFTPEFEASDLLNLGFASVYLKLMIEGIASRPFSASTLGPIANVNASFKDQIVQASRKNYGTPKADVEEEIRQLQEDIGKDPEGPAGGGKGTFTPASRPQVPMFDATCAVCGKPVQVPFQPDPRRPVFCKDHLGLASTYRPAQVPTPPPAPVPAPAPTAPAPLRAPAPAAKTPEPPRPMQQIRKSDFVPRPESRPPVSLSELSKKMEPMKNRFETPKKNDTLQALREALKKSQQEKSNILKPGDRIEL